MSGAGGGLNEKIVHPRSPLRDAGADSGHEVWRAFVSRKRDELSWMK
jgi:hypothetical protein